MAPAHDGALVQELIGPRSDEVESADQSLLRDADSVRDLAHESSDAGGVVELLRKVQQPHRAVPLVALCAIVAFLSWPHLTRPAVSRSVGQGAMMAYDGPMQDPPLLVPSTQGCGLIEDSVDYGAKDLPYNMAQIPSAEMCCALCQSDPDCYAWTWGKERDHLGLTDMCFFKTLKAGEEMSRSHNPKVVSGLARRAIVQGLGLPDTKTTTRTTARTWWTTTPGASTTTMTRTTTFTVTTTVTTAATASSATAHRAKLLHARANAVAVQQGRAGRIRNGRQGNHTLCLDIGEDNSSLVVEACEGHRERQDFTYDGATGRLVGFNRTCVDAKEPGANASVVRMTPCDETDWGQHWSFDSDLGRLRNRHGICLDVAPPYTRGSAVQLWECNRTWPTQRWQVEAQSAPEADFDGALRHRHLGLCLDSAEGAKKGASVRLSKCTGKPVETGWAYRGLTGLVEHQAGICLEALQPGTPNSTVRLAACDNMTWNQQWVYDDVLGHIKNRHGLCLYAFEAGHEIFTVSLAQCQKKEASQHWTLNVGSWSAVSPKPPSKWGHPSFFCFCVMRTKGYEPSLVKLQLKKQVSIFLCDEYAIYSMGEPYYLGDGAEGGVSTFPIPKLQMSEQMGVLAPGQTTNSWLNTMTFMQVWKAVQNDGRYKNHDWTVKVDPDAVFIRERLGWHLAPHTNGEALYVRNTDCFPDIEFFGAVESISRAAVTAYLKGAQRCRDGLQWQGWGEDYFMQHCLDFLGVGHAEDFQMLSDPHCHAKPCSDPHTVTFHPYKDAAGYESCLSQIVPNR